MIALYFRKMLQYLNYSRKLCLAIRKLPRTWQERAYVSLFLPFVNPTESGIIANPADYGCEALGQAIDGMGVINCMQSPCSATYRVLVPRKSTLWIFFCLPHQHEAHNGMLDINITVTAIDCPVISRSIGLRPSPKPEWKKIKLNLSPVARAEAEIAINLRFKKDSNDSIPMRDVLCYGPVLKSFKGFRNIAHSCRRYLATYGVKGLYRKIASYAHDLSLKARAEEMSEKDYIAGGLLYDLLQHSGVIEDGSPMLAARISEDEPVDIVIPIYNAYDHLDTCLCRVFNNTDISARVILIDDCSTDPRIVTLLNQYEQGNFNNKNITCVILRTNSVNCGFTKTVNLGLSMSKGHVVLLNSDTKVPPNWLSRLLRPIIENHDTVASVTPFSNRATICSFPEFCTDNQMYLDLDIDEIDSIFNRYAPRNWITIPVGVGFCMAMNRKALDMLGILDEAHFPRGYGEENDWCMRAAKSGFQNVLTPRLFVEHDHGISWNSLGQNIRESLIEKGLINMEKLHPGYGLLIQKFIDDDPIQPIRNLLISLTHTTHKRLRHNMLILTSALSGGLDAYLRNLMDVIAMDAEIFTCYYEDKTNSSVLTHFREAGNPIHYRVRGNMFTPQTLKQICNLLSIDLVFVNHLLTFPNFHEILATLPVVGIPYVMVVHDYFSVCYSWHLLDDNNEYCQAVTDNDHCNGCIKRGFLKGMYYSPFGLTGNFDAGAWRMLWGEAFRSAKSVVCFSVSSRDILLRYYPFLTKNITIVPHFVTPPTCGESCA